MALFSWANGIFIEYHSMTTKFITDSVLRNSEHKKVSLDSWSPKKSTTSLWSIVEKNTDKIAI